jgi:para-aminobenzoate synthetase component 1
MSAPKRQSSAAIKRSSKTFSLPENFSLQNVLSFFPDQDPLIVLNSNTNEQLQKDPYGSYDLLIAAGSLETTKAGKSSFDSIQTLHEKGDWIFGFLTYDVKNQVEKLHSTNFDGLKLDEYYFFIPRFVLTQQANKITVHYHASEANESFIETLIDEVTKKVKFSEALEKPKIKARISRKEYLENINRIKKHIRRGDIYEMNFCMEFYAENAVIYPQEVYLKLNALSPMPFSAYMKHGNKYLLCASPERFLAKRGYKIISQPIKGTIKRGANETEDLALKNTLKNDPKEQAENVMIVDLVRNDLSRTAEKASVKVEELFGVKTFRMLHQLESTVTSELKKDIHFTEAIQKCFPMGSMTGAPKIRAMELIEEYESTHRGLYSGTIGYITPEGDFDFNVIIRSIIYNSENGYLSFMVGSAITDSANAEKEYEECMLKAEAMKRVLE